MNLVHTARMTARSLYAAAVAVVLVSLPWSSAFAQASDDFNTCGLDRTTWSFVDPLSDSSASIVGAGSGDSVLEISVPAGASHEASLVNASPRLMQTVPDVDFEIDAAFSSVLTLGYQMQGLIVEESPAHYLRFEMYSDGSQTRALVGIVQNGFRSFVANEQIVSGVPVTLRVGRVGDTWSFSYSQDGVVFSPVADFVHTLNVTALGPHAGNYSGSGTAAPAHTAVVDYVFDVANPIAPEDAGSVPTNLTLALVAAGNGTVAASPDQPTYACGDLVTLTATPDADHQFDDWTGDVTGVENPIVLELSQQASTVTANFSLAPVGPTISNVAATPGANSATISWTTDLPATSRVEYGTTPAYELGVVEDPTLTTAHAQTLLGLAPGATYHYRVLSDSAEGASSASADQTFVSSFYAPGSDPSGLVSTDFNECGIDASTWTFVDPIGDGSAALVGGGTGNAALTLTVPGGASHDAGGSNETARLMQSIVDGDIEVEARFESDVTQAYQEQGFLFEDFVTGNFLRFDMYSDGTETYLFAATVTGGSMSVEGNVAVGTDTPDYLRVGRVGDTWTAEYSFDGVLWIEYATFSFSMVLTDVGPFSGNFSSNGTSAPAHTAIVDYFVSTQSPVVPEDGGTLPSENVLSVSVTGSGQVSISPDQPTYACNETVSLTATADPGFEFVGWSGDVVGTDNPTDVTLDGDRNVTATFAIIPAVITNVNVVATQTSATITWTTTYPGSSLVQYGETTAYELGWENVWGRTAQHEVVLTDLSPSTTYFYKLISFIPGHVGVTQGGLSFTTEGPPPFASDDFNTCVIDENVWTFVDPLGDSSAVISGAGSGDARLGITVPTGAEHQPWTTNTSARLMQPAGDTDFDVEVKFDSIVDQAYQEQGILVEAGQNHFLRFDFHFDGTDTRALAARVIDGSPSILSNVVVPSGQGLYLRVERVGDDWTQSYSVDGAVWNPVATVNHALAVDAIGVFSGNAQDSSFPIPAHTALIDYFSIAADPVVDEDLASIPTTVSIDVSSLGQGSVSASPDQPDYACGAPVLLTATPDVGFAFSGWQGDLSGIDNPRTITAVRDVVAEAVFVLDTAPPVVSDVYVQAGSDAAVVSWTTDEPATSRVDFGTTTGYELGFVEDAGLVTNHSVLIQGLSPSTLHHFEITSVDASSNGTANGDATFVTGIQAGTHPSGLYSDDFNKCVVDTGIWTLVDPLGDAGVTVSGAGAGDARIELAVPAGVEHAPVETNASVRLMQDVNDTDFVVEVKFDSLPTLQYQQQGLIIETSPQTYLRFDFYGNGGGTSVLAATFLDGSMDLLDIAPILPSGPIYMRVERVGDQWTQSYSLDGSTWIQFVTFNFPMTVWRVGPFVGNEGVGGVIEAHTAVIDWFNLTESPIVPEDFGAVAGAKTLTVSTVGPGSVTRDPDQASYGCGESVVLTATPDLGYAFDGWSDDLSGDENPVDLLLTADRNVTADFILDTVPPVISDIEIYRSPTTALVLWKTNEPATSAVAYGETPSYELGVESSGVFVKDHSVLISGVDGATTYHLELTSVDGASLSSSSGDVVSGPAEGPVIDVFYGTDQSFGGAGLAQPWVNILGNASDPDGVVSLTYSLNGGPEIPLSMGWDSYRLDRDGDFNADIAASAMLEGMNTVAIRAEDTLGNPSLVVVNVDFTSNVVTPLPFSIDWSTETNIQDVAQVVDGDWVIENGVLRNTEMGYDRLVAIGDISWTDYEATVHITVDAIEPYYASPSNGQAVGLITRWPGHVINGSQPAWRWWPLGAYGHHRWGLRPDGDISQRALLEGDRALTLDSDGGAELTVGQQYVFKMRVETLPDGTVEHSFKNWLSVDPEPTEWVMQGTEAPGTEVPGGSLLIVAHHVQVSVTTVDIQPVGTP